MALTVGYSRRWEADLSGSLDQPAALAGGEHLDVEVLPPTEFAGGIEGGTDFWSTYSGRLDIAQVAAARTVTVILRTVHTIGPKSWASHTSTAIRLPRSVSLPVPLLHFSSNTQVRPGTFDDADGRQITLTAEDLASPVTVQQSIRVVAGGASLTVSSLTAAGRGVWYQLAQQADIAVADLPDSVALESDIPPLTAPWPTTAAGQDLVDAIDGVLGTAWRAGAEGGRPDGTAYATAGQYRSRNLDPDGQTGGDDDGLLAAVLLASSRLVDRRLGWADGQLGPLPDARTVTFWPSVQGRRLWLRTQEGQWALRSWTEIAPDYSGRGRPAHRWTPDDDGAWLLSSPQTGPARSLAIWWTHDDAAEQVWPSPPGGSVAITGQWGRQAVPPLAAELTVATARLMLDGHHGGAASVIGAIEAGVPLTGESARLWRRAEMELSAGRPERLGLRTGGV